MSCPALPLFWMYFQKMGLFFSEWDYYLRSENVVNFTKTYFLNEAACTSMKKYLYMCYVITVYCMVQQIKRSHITLTVKIFEKNQRSAKIIRAVEGSHSFTFWVELCKSFPKWGRWSLWKHLQLKRCDATSGPCGKFKYDATFNFWKAQSLFKSY